MTHTKEYACWARIRQRCEKSSNKAYKDYGGRGITVCDRWRSSFQAFYEDMGPAPHKEASIHRKNNDGNYEPANCIWATDRKTQMREKRNTFRLTHDGKSVTISEWAEILGMSRHTIWKRILTGWPAEAALTLPVGSRCPSKIRKKRIYQKRSSV